MKQKRIIQGISIIVLIMCVFNIFLINPVNAQEKTVSLQVDGNPVNLDVMPFIDAQNRTIVPLRFIGEELGYSFAWDAQAKQVAFTGNGVLIFLTVGSREAIVDGNKMLLDTEAVVKNGRTMVPLRFVLENLGVKVDFDSSTKIVNIITKNGGNDKGTIVKTAVIAENVVNVRSGPGLTYPIITKVKKGSTYQVLSQSSDWYQIAVDNETPGWVAGWVVTVRTETSSASRSEEPGEGRDLEPEPVRLAHIDKVDVDVSNGEVFVTVSGDETLYYTVFSLDNPRRLVVDFFNSVLKDRKSGEEKFEVDTELVTGIRMAQFSENQVRVVADVTAPAGLTLIDNEPSKITFKIGKPSIVGKTIVIDPGHASIQPGGWADPGAVGPSNLYEKDVVLDIGLKLSDILKAKGANVIMTRTGNTTLTLGGRADVANKNRADIFVSIHANANTSRAIHGTSTYFYGGVAGQYEARQKLAKSIQSELVKTIQRRDIGVLQSPFAVLKYTKVPSVLVETAFISNYEEEKLLADPEFRQKVAQGIAQGIEKYFAY
ncbi:MAG: N-acetylmuramoyl-L-alanine amidase [Bacillota bacterium]|nr:SH3 domain-containing protein [Clostridia bacterium]